MCTFDDLSVFECFKRFFKLDNSSVTIFDTCSDISREITQATCNTMIQVNPLWLISGSIVYLYLNISDILVLSIDSEK